MPRSLRTNGLSVFFGAIFLLTLVGQALVGHADYNHLQVAHHDAPLSLARYVTSSDFGADVLENWQSEYLQFTLYILTTVWLLQRGSPESKPLGEAGRESDADQLVGDHADERSPRWARVGGLRTRLYSHSLVLVMGAVWFASWGVQAVAGRLAYNADQLEHQEAALTLVQYVGSPESKPVGAPHSATGTEG